MATSTNVTVVTTLVCLSFCIQDALRVFYCIALVWTSTLVALGELELAVSQSLFVDEFVLIDHFNRNHIMIERHERPLFNKSDLN